MYHYSTNPLFSNFLFADKEGIFYFEGDYNLRSNKGCQPDKEKCQEFNSGLFSEIEDAIEDCCQKGKDGIIKKNGECTKYCLNCTSKIGCKTDKSEDPDATCTTTYIKVDPETEKFRVGCKYCRTCKCKDPFRKPPR